MEFLTPKEAADLLKISEQTLAIWRCTKRYDLPYYRVGRRIRYTRADIDAFVAQNRFCLAEKE